MCCDAAVKSGGGGGGGDDGDLAVTANSGLGGVEGTRRTRRPCHQSDSSMGPEWLQMVDRYTWKIRKSNPQ